MIEGASIRGERGTMLVSTARIATRRAASYADQLAERLGQKVAVESLPGGYRLTFGRGEGLLNYGPEELSLLVSADDGPSLGSLRDALGVYLERLGHADDLRVRWHLTLARRPAPGPTAGARGRGTASGSGRPRVR
ncbi:hypothetical protein GCM10029992_47390 [Glycomyces albus]